MRKLLFILFAGIFFGGCTKSDDGNGSSNVTVVPLTPTELKANVISTTQVDLSWTDKSTNENGFKIQRKTGSGNFTNIGTVGKDLTNYTDNGLTPSTTYTYRVYAYNSTGASLGYTNEVTVNTNQGNNSTNSPFNPNLSYGTVSDIDGNTYKTIQIGTQTWMAENLRTTKYRNGIYIPKYTSNTEWINDTNGGWCYYNNADSNNIPYGKLYNWYAVNNANQICPDGWHVPSDTEWTTLINFIDLSSDGGNNPNIAGSKMKSTGTQYWQSPNTSATNSSGFSGLPGGYRYYPGLFVYIGLQGHWWSATLENNDIENDLNAWFRWIIDNGDAVVRFRFPKSSGLSVRCIKD